VFKSSCRLGSDFSTSTDFSTVSVTTSSGSASVSSVDLAVSSADSVSVAFSASSSGYFT